METILKEENQNQKKKRGHPINPDTQKIDQSRESYMNFVRRFRNSPMTKKGYTDRLRNLMQYCNLPDVRAKIGVQVGDNSDLLLFDNDSRKIQNILKCYMDYQYSRGLSPI